MSKENTKLLNAIVEEENKDSQVENEKDNGYGVKIKNRKEKETGERARSKEDSNAIKRVSRNLYYTIML